MKPYAVIETGGKQYRVEEGTVLSVERLETEAGQNVKLDKVLAVSTNGELSVGEPALEGVALTAKVLEHYRGKKVVSFKKKRRKGYTRKQGHRQELTKIEILDLGSGKTAAKETKKKAAKPAEKAEAVEAASDKGESDGS